MKSLLTGVALAALMVCACSPDSVAQATPDTTPKTNGASPSDQALAAGEVATDASAAETDPVEYPPFSKAPALGAPGPRTYETRDGPLVLPLGSASFADEVVRFRSGRPPAQDIRYRNAGAALGEPDYVSDADDEESFPKDVTLGCGGELVLRFTNNALIDVPGKDLYIFEVGPMVEATRVAISTDGETWLEVGEVEGGTASLDISRVARPGVSYHYVRLTDPSPAGSCNGDYPGADIDAVAAIGAALSISLDSSVMFDVDKAELKPAARAELDRAAGVLKAWPGKVVTVEGHTDSTGSAARNDILSQARAQAVRDYLAGKPELSGKTISAKGFGASRPVDSNATEQGRQKNRRVDVIMAPDR
jgi:outer membrane protein OmpA-like peptidoglycan-associated protein